MIGIIQACFKWWRGRITQVDRREGIASRETVGHIPAKIEVGRTTIKEERNGAEGRAGKKSCMPKNFQLRHGSSESVTQRHRQGRMNHPFLRRKTSLRSMAIRRAWILLWAEETLKPHVAFTLPESPYTLHTYLAKPICFHTWETFTMHLWLLMWTSF